MPAALSGRRCDRTTPLSPGPPNYWRLDEVPWRTVVARSIGHGRRLVAKLGRFGGAHRQAIVDSGLGLSVTDLVVGLRSAVARRLGGALTRPLSRQYSSAKSASRNRWPRSEEGEGQTLSLTCGHASARLHCEDPGTFPPLQ